MLKIDMPSPYYVYKLINPQTSEFYIGSHFCNGKQTTCRTGACRYRGSSKMIKKPNEWNKVILAFTPDRKTLADLEKAWIESTIVNPLSLNKIVASPSRLPVYSDEAKARLKKAIKREFVTMVHELTGEVRSNIKREDVSSMLYAGWHMKNKVMWIKNNKLKQHGQYSSKTVMRLWKHIQPLGWEFGHDGDFEKINAKQLRDSANIALTVKRENTYIYSSL